MVAHRAALARLWLDRCNIIIQKKRTDPTTKITGFRDELLWENQPCKLSFTTFNAATGEETAAAYQTVKLFLPAALSVLPGSKVEVIRPGGVVLTFQSSGAPAVFTDHQEIQLERSDRWC